MDLKGKKIVFLGDSITEGHSTSGIGYRYSDIIEREEGAICYNYGISGTRIARQHAPSEEPSWDKCFLDRVEEMEPDADVVVVFGGTNDHYHGDAAVGCMADRDEYTFYGALHSLALRIINRYPTAKVLFLTPLHRKEEDKLVVKGGVITAVSLSQYASIIREVMEYYSIPVLDLYRVGRMTPHVPILKEMYMPDEVHPNDEGQKILAELITAYLKHNM